MPITLDIRRELVEGWVSLHLHVAWRLLRQGVSFTEALNVRVDIYRHTSLYDGKVFPYNAPPGWRDERWEGLLTNLHDIFDRHATEATSEAIEREGYQLLQPALEAALERGVAQWPRPEDRPYGFFAYNLTDLKKPPARAIELHLSNPFVPASPFADRPARKRELGRLVADACAAHAGLTHVTSTTWLNAFPPFLALFPSEWAASATPYTGVFPGWGLWGQFCDRRGGFHRENAEFYRKTGRFRYLPLTCWCRIEALDGL